MTEMARLHDRRSAGFFKKKTWSYGNDIYGLRDKESISPNDAEGKLDHLDKNLGFTRSSFYHAYWRGWTEVRVDRLGRPYSVERVYTAPWIRQDVPERSYILIRLLYGVLLLFAVGVFCFSMTRRIGCNYCWYVALFGMPAVILMLLTLFVFARYVTVPRKMTLWEHRASATYLRCLSLIFSILLALTALATLTYLFLNPSDQPLLHLRNAVLELVAFGSVFAVSQIERHIQYVDLPNDNKAPAGGREIR